MFTCAGCKNYDPDGWPMFKAAGGVIRQGECLSYFFYNHETARRLCDGKLKVEHTPNMATPTGVPENSNINDLD